MFSTSGSKGQAPAEDAPPGTRPGRHRGAGPVSPSYHRLLQIGEFRALWSAQILAYLGEQVAQVAIAILVYARTRSPLLTGLAYALSYLAPIAGRPLLSGLADIVPRRRLMIAVDLLRAGLVMAMALPSLSLAGVCTLLLATVLLGSPHAAARSALLAEVLPPDSFVLGAAVSNITFQASQIGGFLAGGTLVAVSGPHLPLALDAGVFAGSAVVLASGLAARPRPAPQPVCHPFWATLRVGGKVAFSRPELRGLLLFGWLAGFAVVPEGLAVPYARTLGGGPLTVGLLMSAMPVGMITAALLLARLTSPPTRLRMMGWLAMSSCAPLTISLLRPPLALILPLWVLAGAGAAYQLAAAPAFVRALPDTTRAQAFAVAQTGLLAAQGLAVVIAGAVTDEVGPQPVVAFAGLSGLSLAGVLATWWARHRCVLAAEGRDGPDPVAG